MKIIIFSNSLWSIYNFRTSLIKSLLIKGFEVILIAPKDKYYSKLNKIGCKINLIDTIDRSLNPFIFLKLFFRIFMIIKNEKPKAVLSFTVKPNIFTGIICGILNIPSIVMITGLGYVFTFNRFLSKLILIIYKISFFKTNYIFFQNKDDFTLFKLNKIIQNKFMILPGSGVNLNKFKKFKYPNSKKINFILIARNIREKGIYEFVSVASELKKEKKNIEFTYLGYTDSHEKTFIKKEFFVELQKKNIINFIQQKPDVQKYLKKAHCIVLPTYREGMPRSVIEGFATGRPAIVSKVVGTKKLIITGKNGYFCKTMNKSSLKEAIKRFYDLSLKRKIYMGNYSRKFVEKKYDEKIVISKYWKALKKILNK